MKKNNNIEEKEIALGRIRSLFAMADDMYKKDKNYSDRYVELARKISTKNKVRIPKELKFRFCKNCSSYLVPGDNARFRLQNHKIVVLCKICKHLRRYPYKR